MTTQEHMNEFDRCGFNPVVVGAAVRHLLNLAIANETHQRDSINAIVDHGKRLEVLESRFAPPPPEPPAVPDHPQLGEIWAGKDGACIVCYLEGGNVWFLSVASSCIIGNMRPSAITLMSWHAWVRETQAKRIWPEVKEV